MGPGGPKAATSSERGANSASFKGRSGGGAAVAGDVPSSDPAVGRVQEVLKLLETDPDRVDALLSELSTEFFRAGGQWRETFQGLMTLPGRESHLKILALKEYLQYLKTAPPPDPPAPSPYAATDAPSQSPGGLEGHLRTIVPGVPASPAPRVLDSEFIRPPHKESVPVHPDYGRSLEIWLSHHHFRFTTSNGPLFIDSNGRSYLLREGPNYLGRAPYNDVVVDSEYTDVSRRHLVLEIRDGRLSAITDLSSRGTFVPVGACRGES